MRRHRSHTSDGTTGTTGQQHHLQQTTRYREDSMMEGDSILPPHLRDRLGDLFSQIEKEFEHLYAANLALQDRVDFLTEKLGGIDTASVDKPPLLEPHDVAEYAAKNKKPQLTQRIKTTYKQSTSKLVSSFRQPHAAFTLVRHYRGHRDGVWEVSVSRSQHAGGQVIATASADHSGRVYSIETGACFLQYLGHRGSVNSVRFHPTQDLVLSASGDGTAHIWRAQMASQGVAVDVTKSQQSSGEEEPDSSEREDGAEDLPDYLSGHASNLVRGPALEFAHHVEVVTAADWLSQGSQVVTASWDRTASLADAETGEQVSSLCGHDQELTDVHAHTTQRLVLTSSKDTTFRLWDMRGHAMAVNVFQGHTQQVNTAVFASSADKVVSGSDDRTVKVWDMRNMRSPIAAIRTDSEVNRLSVSPTQNVIAIPHDNRNIRLFDLNGVRIGRLPRNNRQGHSRMVCATAWADTNSTCNLFSCGFDRQVLGWMINVHSKE